MRSACPLLTALLSLQREFVAAAVDCSFVLSTIDSLDHLDTTRIAFKVKFIQFFSFMSNNLTWNLNICTTDLSLIKVRDMSIPTSYRKNVTCISRTQKWWRRYAFLC